MPSIRITAFGGINTEIAPRLAANSVAQIAHNCLLWDGSLRPLAKWIKVQGIEYEDAFSIDLNAEGAIVSSPLADAAFLRGEKYLDATKVGLADNYFSTYDSNIGYANRETDADGMAVGIHRPHVDVSSSISYTRQYQSDKPVNRMYAVSGIRRTMNGYEESTLTLLPNQTPNGIIYEGDTALITLVVNALVPDQYTGFRLYRTISGLDTGASTMNELDTEWYLIAELNGGTDDGIAYSHVYVDGGSATTDPLDLYLASNFYPPRRYLYRHLQILEGGWIAAATAEGEISISERYLYHAWPIENFYRIPGEKITDFKAQFDNIFIGTENEPYVMAVGTGEKLGVQAAITPFPESYGCLPNTMDKTPAGAIYASSSGLVSLARDGMKLITAGTTSGVRPLYKIPYETTKVIDAETVDVTKLLPMRYQDTKYGAYSRGTYFGFCRIDTNELNEAEEPVYLFKGYMYNTGSSLDGDRALQRFVTFDTPANVRAHTSGGSGLFVLASDGVYRMPFPDSVGNEVYARSPKYCYNWKSKKFVFPGQMSFAACKIVHDCKGFVRIKIFVDCCCVYQVEVTNCQPFTLPPNMVGVEWEVELVGTSAVHEVHLASSLRELIEHE